MIFILTGCTSINSLFLIESSRAPSPEDTKLTRSEEYQKEIDELLAADAENKKWERIFIKEIEVAQKHEDWDAYQFFLREYIITPRFKLPEWVKKEPGYVPGISSEDVEGLK
jgi:hypothetical protein